MSKINALRLINLNYNNNAIRISDETFHLNGVSSLLSLRNGGGKSVLVQMMMAPFVHKRYRDAKDRPFDSYFTTNRPTFILVEWMLDQGAGYVLTGMMIRKNQDVAGDNEQQKENLEIVNFICEYKERCIQDIHHLPVVEKVKKEMTLKSFASCRQLFESYKRDRSVSFFYYDMNNQAQQKQYFDKLTEYKIHYKEWETIIKKVNLKESGLSDLFADCRDEKGLVEKWFLDSVENKLNKDKNRMKEFQNIIEKYVEQYKENKSKIQRRDTILRFKEEADKIMTDAAAYEEVLKNVSDYENRIANFIGQLEGLRGQEENNRREIRQERDALLKLREYLEYEELSKGYYELKEQESYHISNREMITAERDALEEEGAEIERKLHLFLGAKQQETCEENHSEFLEAEQRLAVSKKNAGELEPERQAIGYTLKCHYREQSAAWEKQQQENESAVKELQEKITDGKEETINLQSGMLEETKEIAAGKVRIDSFLEREERFNRQYKEQFVRNILGEYEPGMLEIRQSSFKKELEQKERERIEAKRKQDGLAEEKKAMYRRIEDMKKVQSEQQMEHQKVRQEREYFEEELIERKKILKYLKLEASDIFDREKILLETGKMLTEIERVRRTHEKEEEELQKEYMRLTQGKVLELPEEFEAVLAELGLHYVYGMEWMKKNGYTKQQNMELVDRRPFLPYALLLSKQDLNKLEERMKRQGEQIYTSFPIPILLREELEQDETSQAGGVVSLSNIQFYVYFNQNLLDEEKLARMIAEKEARIQKVRKAIEQKKTEYADYLNRQEKIKNQKVTEKNYGENKERLNRMEQDAAELAQNILTAQEKREQLETELEELFKKIMELGTWIDRGREKLIELKDFIRAYAAYLEEKQNLARHEKKALRLKEQLRLLTEQIDKYESGCRTLENEGRDLLRKAEETMERYSRYVQFEETKCVAGIPKELEAKYQAMTSKISEEQKELEERITDCRKRYEKSKEEFTYIMDKYSLQDTDIKSFSYNRKEEQHQEILLEDCRKKAKTKSFLWNEEDKKLAVLLQQISEQKKKLSVSCGKEEPLAKSEILTENFEAEKNRLAYEEKEKFRQEDILTQKINGYDSNLTALAEYADLKAVEEVMFEQEFAKMNRKELDAFKGMLVRDYRLETDKKQECRSRLMQLLNRILRIEEFQEDFYRKPLEALLELSGDATQVIAQLNTTVWSYESLMKKLEVDISMIEKEKAKIVELLEDYVREIHENLGKIDHNSTIVIRERPIKMLKIKLLDWEENQAVFQVRIQDFIDEITKKGIEIFEANENAQEFFGTRITTKNLYDTVVGIASVQIRLYKIEEMREYPITWADVAKNSGGEGFLSAFVILSSLLYYMRRDESDIFADRNEGKVLVMDNPFAQTNASHLLKPLMDMADKTNTQLICLSGLGGESIYNRFRNIYVLNLVAASLRNGMQYLKTEHTKGSEGETVIASQIEVVQQELIF